MSAPLLTQDEFDDIVDAIDATVAIGRERYLVLFEKLNALKEREVAAPPAGAETPLECQALIDKYGDVHCVLPLGHKPPCSRWSDTDDPMTGYKVGTSAMSLSVAQFREALATLPRFAESDASRYPQGGLIRRDDVLRLVARYAEARAAGETTR